MKIDRRIFAQGVLAFSTVLSFPRTLFAARPDTAFDATDADAVYNELFGEMPADSDRVKMKMPDIAENGRPATTRPRRNRGDGRRPLRVRGGLNVAGPGLSRRPRGGRGRRWRGRGA